ncbi:hypothetical protein ACC771_09940, partial [Rhizobium ruizarguesonis]
LLIAVVATIIIVRWAHKRQAATGQPFHTVWTSIALIVGLPLLVFVVSGFPLTFDVPVAGKFNLTGGSVVGPEFMSLFLALSFNTEKGQKERHHQPAPERRIHHLEAQAAVKKPEG